MAPPPLTVGFNPTRRTVQYTPTEQCTPVNPKRVVTIGYTHKELGTLIKANVVVLGNINVTSPSFQVCLARAVGKIQGVTVLSSRYYNTMLDSKDTVNIVFQNGMYILQTACCINQYSI
jgi:ABC-type Fe3+-hydroxamate transport system substrate-binding protein